MMIIEVIGLANSGKSHLIKTFVRRGVSGHGIQEIGSDRRVEGRFINRSDALSRQEWVFCSMVSEMIFLSDCSRADFLFIHRGPWDAIAFSRGLVLAGLVLPKDVRPLLAFAKSETKRIDLVVWMDVSVEESLKRKRAGVPDGSIINRQTLSFFASAYRELKDKIPPEKLVILDGTKDAETNYHILLKHLVGEKRGEKNE